MFWLRFKHGAERSLGPIGEKVPVRSLWVLDWASGSWSEVWANATVSYDAKKGPFGFFFFASSTDDGPNFLKDDMLLARGFMKQLSDPFWGICGTN